MSSYLHNLFWNLPAFSKCLLAAQGHSIFFHLLQYLCSSASFKIKQAAVNFDLGTTTSYTSHAHFFLFLSLYHSFHIIFVDLLVCIFTLSNKQFESIRQLLSLFRHFLPSLLQPFQSAMCPINFCLSIHFASKKWTNAHFRNKKA